MDTASQSEKLSFWTKFAYGSGDLGTAISAALRGFFLIFFLTDVARLNPVAVGVIFFVNRFWDAVNDPIIGWLSDRTHTRWGRRRPWLLWGAVPFGLLYFMLWLVPPLGSTGLIVYYMLVLLVLDTTYTVVNVPYTALTPELTRDYDERTSLNSYRFGFSVGGALVSAVLHPIIVGQFADPRTGYMASGALWGVVGTVSILVAFFFTRERPETAEEMTATERTPYLQQVRTALSNRPYLYVMGLYLFSWLSLQLIQVVLVYYATYYMGIAERMPMILGAVQGASLIFLFVWAALSRKLEKRTVYMIGATLWLSVMLALSFLRPDQDHLVIPLALLAGAGVSVAYLIPWAMMPDVMEADELETGMRREGIFYGFMVFLQKASIALAGLAVTWSLSFTGYVTPTDAMPAPVQPESALAAIRFFIGPVPAIILAASLLIAWRYPITRASHAGMVEALRARRAAQAALPAEG